MTKSKQASNAQKMLREYRSTIWRKSALEAVPGVGKNELSACVEQMNFTKELTTRLRSNKLLGEKLYWVIYASYLTERQPGDVGEILAVIAQNFEHIPRRTYFRLKKRAIKMMDEQLKEIA